VRLDTGPKRLLDAVKVVARNVFYRALAPFKAAYDNYRDDHEHGEAPARSRRGYGGAGTRRGGAGEGSPGA
jgi:hypothetical protein